jgi:hypothetical protein
METQILANVKHSSILFYLKKSTGCKLTVSTAVIVQWWWWVNVWERSIGGITVTGVTNVLEENLSHCLCPTQKPHGQQYTVGGDLLLHVDTWTVINNWRWLAFTCGHMDSNKQFGTLCNFLLWNHLKTTQKHSFNLKGLFVFGVIAPSGPGSPHSRGF